MSETELRELMAAYGRSLFARGYGCGSSGNLSARLEDGSYLLTPTNVSLGELTPDGLTRLSADGGHMEGPRATKEAWLHMAVYRARPAARAVVHLHSTYAVAMSCLTGRDPKDLLPPITPYAVMRCGCVAMAPYFTPGDDSFAGEIEAIARDHRSMLLANHGPVVAGPDLPSAIASAEELEETAKLYFILKDHPHRLLDADQVQAVRDRFGA